MSDDYEATISDLYRELIEEGERCYNSLSDQGKFAYDANKQLMLYGNCFIQVVRNADGTIEPPKIISALDVTIRRHDV